MSEFGPPENLVPSEVPELVAGPGEALVDIELANVTFVETQIRAGRAPHPSMLPELPVVPGNGVGGVVAWLGRGSEPRAAGARVIATTGGSGAYAERVTVPAEALIEVPDELELQDAVALLADGRTAFALMQAAAVKPGDTILVEAAGGGVGSLLVQLARAAGARVIAAAGGARKLELAAELGADCTVDYREPAWAEGLSEQVGGLDVAFDGVGGEIGRAAFELVRPGGRFCAYGMASGAFVAVFPMRPTGAR